MRLLGAHEVAATRVFAVARVSGVMVVLWAVAAGIYIFLGGVAQLTNPVFAPLVEGIGGYKVVGGILAIGGIVGLLGLMFVQRWMSILSCMICSAWSGAVAVFLFIAAASGIDNLGAWFAVFCCGIYTLRFFLLVEVPKPDKAMHLE